MGRLSLLLSFLIVAFGAPSLSGTLSIGAGAFGYALFWLGCLSLERWRFWIASIWFAAVQAVQLSWLASLEYMGPLILGVYAFVLIALGFQFGFLTALIRIPLGLVQVFSLSGFWVLMEWSRLFFLTGFSWNPVGLTLAASPFSIQFAALFGVYGLCFLVMCANLLALRALLAKTDKKKWGAWVLCAILPYAYGVVHRTGVHTDRGREMTVALVQTALRPEERDFLQGKERLQVHPLEQWDRILSYLQQTGEEKFDLIVLPEGALPNGAKHCIYPVKAVQAIWERHFGAMSIGDFPLFGEPFTEKGEGGSQRASNAFWLQGLCNHFGAEVIAGLDDWDGGEAYNAAFHFIPGKEKRIDRYEKRILIPVGEYIPFLHWKWLAKFVADQFGIGSSFSVGKREKIFQGMVPIGIFICLEETYSHFIRKIRRAGAELFVNLTNDVWFPETRLPWHHFAHGRLRAVENGIYLLRACNTGVTAAVDCFGDPVAIFPVSDRSAGALCTKVFVRSFSTPYTFWGDFPLLIVSAGCFAFLLCQRSYTALRQVL